MLASKEKGDSFLELLICPENLYFWCNCSMDFEFVRAKEGSVDKLL